MQMLTRRRIKQILALAIVLPTAALIAVIVFRQLGSAPPEQVPQPASSGVDMAMNNLHFSEMRDDAKLWQLVATRGDYDKKTGLVRLSGVHLETFEGKTGGVMVTSTTGSYHEAKRLVVMEGAVHAVTRKGMTFDSDMLEYHPATGMLLTDRAVTVDDGRLHLTARGMEASLKDEQVRFQHQVDAVIKGNHAKR